MKINKNKSKSYKVKLTNKNHKFCILIHGGAGNTINDIDSAFYYSTLETIILSIYQYINTSVNLTAVDICEYAVKMLEDNPLFNAGKGAVFTDKNTHELEASIMDGKNLNCGAVSMIKRVKNPISAARLVMDRTKHNYIVGKPAEDLAKLHGLTFVKNSYFTTTNKKDDVKKTKFGTVGAVCLYNGSLAAATSTGGVTNKMSGRIGDSPIIGAGTYASNDTCAVSATGWGEEFMRRVAAYDIVARMKYGGKNLETACRETVFDYLPDNSGGIIAVDIHGNISMTHNSQIMFRGMLCDDSDNINNKVTAKVGIWDNMISVKLPPKNKLYSKYSKTIKHKIEE